jgi:hypothetical protein
MCPVRAAAELVSSIFHSGTPLAKIPELKINMVIQNGKLYTIPSSMILTRI